MQITPNMTTGSASLPSSEDRTALTSDYEMFLQMLTTQMNNQDPLNPVDSSDYATQLATFSSVEQQVKTNELLENLTAGMGLSELGNWVGKEVRAVAPAQFTGEPITISPDFPIGTTSATLSVVGSSGQVVNTFEIDPTQETLEWSGEGAGGASLPNGSYTFLVEARSGSEVISAGQAAIYARITEAQSAAAGTSLILAGGTKVDPNDVTAIRN